MKNGLLSPYHYENLLDLGAHFTKRTTVLYLEWSQVSDYFCLSIDLLFIYLFIIYLFIYLFIYYLFIYLFIYYIFIYLSRVTTFGFA